MKKILLISQYFNFKESNTTAISIHSRINGVKNKFDFDVYCFENAENKATDKTIKAIECENDLSIKDNDLKMEIFSDNAFDYVSDNKERYDLILLHSNYAATHDLVKRIKAISNIKILIYMPDPYVSGPNKLLDGGKYAEKVQSEFDAYNLSEKAIVTNEFFKQYMVEEYPQLESKIEYVYHSYDDLDYEVSDSLNIVFIGALYFGRKIDNVLIAFDQLLTEKPELRKFRFISSINNSKALHKTINSLQNKSNFQFIHKRISFTEASKIELSAYGLVNVAMPIPGKNIDPYFPTKLAQAFKTCKPILSISDNKGLSSELMLRTSNYYAINDVEEIKSQLLKLMENGNSKINKKQIEKFNTKYTSLKFEKIINDVIDGR